jgi:hypothetical protein
MPDSIAWSFNAGSGTGSGISGSGTFTADAVTTASASVDAGSSKTLDLQIADMTKVIALAITADRYDGSVSVKGAGASDATIALHGPLLAFGTAAAGRIASSLATLAVSAANAPAQPAAIRILLATSLT